jgi:2-C-methyl-D-erythritol 4-phosphate cytidylyltransferase / 2-C-methyl-D-erythritol 2,4-cyclodiphosphate synthase
VSGDDQAAADASRAQVPSVPPLGVDVIVVAAGASRRMGGLDKLGTIIGGRPLLAWTLAALAAAPAVERIVVVAAAERVAGIRAAAWLPSVVVAVETGGARRQESVANGLAALDRIDQGATLDREHAGRDGSADRVVLVHDGARPLVSRTLVTAVADAAARHGAAIPVMAVAESLKQVRDGMVAGNVDRSVVAAAQTPQGARRSLLRHAFAAYPADGPLEFTDEASLLEACRIPVHAIPGEASNLKVTLPDDLRRVEQALAATPMRVGLGHDSHPFGPGGPLRLGGIEIDRAPRLHGHSDGDVALHAVADALLGAAALGDLGRLFPADERTPRGIASTELIGAVRRRLLEAGLRPASVDVVIIAARPRLGARLDAMRETIAGLLELPQEQVSVKASSGNLAGMEGAGRGISARAIATVRGAG